MQWPEVARRLSRLAPPFPLDAIDELRRRWEEWGQHLVAEIERIADGGEPWNEAAQEYDSLFVFATWLVAERRDARAYRPLVRACHCSSERADTLFGDDLGEHLGRMLAAVCDGDLQPLRDLAEDATAGMWCRYAALHAMLVRVLEGDAARKDVIPWLEEFCAREAARMRQERADFSDDQDLMLTWAADILSILGDAEAVEKADRWFAEGLIHESVFGPDHFAKRLGQDLQQRLDLARRDSINRCITDVVREIGDWACFTAHEDGPYRSEPVWLDRAMPTLGSARIHPGEGTYKRAQPKIGRNDPCPCGSGRKYKKCCGQADGAATRDEEGGEGGVARCIAWLMLHHEDAVREAVQDMLEAWAGDDEEEALAGLDEETWQMIRINLMESLLAGELIEVHGQSISVPELLLGPRGPAMTSRERSWIAQLAQRPLRLYTVTQTVPGVSLTLCDALDLDAPPVVVEEKTASRTAHIGMTLGARILTLGDRHVLSGAAYPFADLFVPALMAELRELIDAYAEQPEIVNETVAFTLQSHWLRQYLVPPPIPTLIDKGSGRPILFIRDRYRVRDWPALERALQSQPDVEGDRGRGWSRLLQGADGLTRSRLAIERPKDAPDCVDVLYRTGAAAEEGRPWFEALAGDAVEFVERERQDPKVIMMLSGMSGRDDETPAPKPDLPPEAMADIIEKVYLSTYANWADEPIPVLGNRTPREAIRTPAGLERVKGLLRLYEQSEKASATQQGRRAVSYDFLWAQLGLTRD